MLSKIQSNQESEKYGHGAHKTVSLLRRNHCQQLRLEEKLVATAERTASQAHACLVRWRLKSSVGKLELDSPRVIRQPPYKLTVIGMDESPLTKSRKSSL